MHHLIIGQFVRYKMASKMAAKIVHLNESNPKYTPAVIYRTEGHKKWEIKAYIALHITLLPINLMYP